MRAALLPLLAAALAAPAAGQYRAWEATSRDAATTAAARSALYSDLTGLVAFKSVSAKGPAPDWTDETEGGPATVREAAWWCFNRLEALGLENAAVMETGEVGRDAPIVYADWLHAGPGEPTVLVYAHYDVQPVEPLGAPPAPAISRSPRVDVVVRVRV